MARKKQTYTIGDPVKKPSKKTKTITHSISPLPKLEKKRKPKKVKKEFKIREKSDTFYSQEKPTASMNNAFAEAFKKAGLTAKDFAKK